MKTQRLKSQELRTRKLQHKPNSNQPKLLNHQENETIEPLKMMFITWKSV